MIATKKGIYAASRFLRHADIQVTAMHYADHKERVTVDMGALLQPENVTEIKSEVTAEPMARARKQKSMKNPARDTSSSQEEGEMNEIRYRVLRCTKELGRLEEVAKIAAMLVHNFESAKGSAKERRRR